MEPNHIFQRLAKLNFFIWLNQKHSYFPLLEELEIYANDMLDQDSIIRTSYNALAIRFFKERYGIVAFALPGQYRIEFSSILKMDAIVVEGTNVSVEESNFELIKHVLRVIDTIYQHKPE